MIVKPKTKVREPPEPKEEDLEILEMSYVGSLNAAGDALLTKEVELAKGWIELAREIRLGKTYGEELIKGIPTGKKMRSRMRVDVTK